MELYHKELGQGEPIIILHGLYGSSDNWVKIAKGLETTNKIYLLDLRNHGKSPHSDEFCIRCMADDLREFATKNNLNNFILMGHSLGGKVSMEFATNNSEMLKKLIIVDIAPRNYINEEFAQRNNHTQIVNLLKDVDLQKFKNRSEALEELSKIDNSDRLKFFMMKNIKRDKNGKMSWKINIKAIADNLTTVLNEFDADLSKITCDTLFIKGEKSDYLTEKDFFSIKKRIKNVDFKIIKDTTHWLHGEKPEEFLEIIKNFIAK